MEVETTIGDGHIFDVSLARDAGLAAETRGPANHAELCPEAVALRATASQEAR
jgi:hypothetical protein